MDEIDIESARLEFLNEQKKKRRSEILKENEGLFWKKPTASDPEPYGTDNSAPSQAAVAFAKTRKIRRE